jgi:hypothetical protein
MGDPQLLRDVLADDALLVTARKLQRSSASVARPFTPS